MAASWVLGLLGLFFIGYYCGVCAERARQRRIVMREDAIIIDVMSQLAAKELAATDGLEKP